MSELHPDAVDAGWVRSFRANGNTYEVAHESYSQAVFNGCARAAGLRPIWTVEASFGEPEREVFVTAGKGDAFELARNIRAILISCWERP